MWANHSLSIFPLLLLHCWQIESSVFYTDEEQQQTRPLPVNRKKMAQLQGQILSVLGLEKPAAGLGELTNQPASQYMSSLYKEISEVDQEDNFNPNFWFLGENSDEELKFDFQGVQQDSHSSDTIISFMPTNIVKSKDPDLSDVYVLLFQLANNFNGLQLVGAQLYFILKNKAKTNSQVTVMGYSRSPSSGVRIHSFGSSNNSALISLNITQIFKEWLNHTQDPQKLFAKLTVDNGTANSSVDITQMHCFGVGFFVENEHNQLNRVKRSMAEHMVVEENWDEEEESRASSHEDSPTFSIHKESNGNSSSKPTNVFRPVPSFTEKRCKLRSLYVDFKDLGWDGWVIAPTGYQADYCDGDCSFPLDGSVAPTNHAIVQTLVHVLDERRALAAQCAPTVLKSQSILFFNNQQNVVMRRYQNMRVKQCGCR